MSGSNSPNDSAPTQTLMVRVSGPDRPGITAALMTLFDRLGATVADIEQVVVRRHLSLGVVVELDATTSLAEIRAFGIGTGLSVDVESVDATPTEHTLGVVVTVLAPALGAADIAAVAEAIARSDGNIDRIVRLSRYPVVSYEFTVLGAPVDRIRGELLAAARKRGIDVAIQPDGLGRRSQRLVVLDVDSTLIRDEVIELLAEEADCGEQVRAITARAMSGELDFETALRERVRLLSGLHVDGVERAVDKVRLTPGARTFVRTLKRMGFKVAILSGGFTVFTERLREELHLDHAVANELEIVDGRVTGNLRGRIVDRRRKAELLVEVAALEGIPLDQTVAVGDGANDLDMLAAAGLGIAFNAKPVVREAVETALNVPYLDAILFMLGIRRSEVEAADATDPRDDADLADRGLI